MKDELPGTGKTTAIKNSGYKVLFVTPYNKSCQELRKDDTKLQNYTEQIANINIPGEYTKKAKSVDLSFFDAISFDEILLFGPHCLYKVASVHRRSPADL